MEKMAACPICEKQYKKQGMGTHIRNKHTVFRTAVGTAVGTAVQLPVETAVELADGGSLAVGTAVGKKVDKNSAESLRKRLRGLELALREEKDREKRHKIEQLGEILANRLLKLELK